MRKTFTLGQRIQALNDLGVTDPELAANYAKFLGDTLSIQATLAEDGEPFSNARTVEAKARYGTEEKVAKLLKTESEFVSYKVEGRIEQTLATGKR